MTAIGTAVTDCLGRSRPVARTFEDGSFECPFCSAPAVAPATRCENPGCPASRWCFDAGGIPLAFVIEPFRARVAEEARRVEDEARRRRDHAAAMARIEEGLEARRAERAARLAEADRRGACPRCATRDLSRPATFVRHRGGVCRRAR